MKSLSAYAIKQIDAYDFRVFRMHKARNITRTYIYLTRNGSDVEVHWVAVKSRKDGTACIKEVIRASVDDKNMYAKDIVYGTLYGYSIDWSPEKLGAKHEWDYRGEWNDMPYIAREMMFKPDRHIINVDMLKRVRRFKYCQFNLTCGRIIDYLKLYVKHPRIEMLVKLGLERFARLPGFVKQLDGDKALLRFFMSNVDEIKKQHYATDVIKKAYVEKVTLREASLRIYYMRYFGGHLPGGIDETKAHDYIEAQNVSATWYREYLDNCVMLKYDLSDTKTAFPKRLKKRMKLVQDIVDEIRRRERIVEDEIRRKQQIEEQKKMNINIAAVSKKLARLEKIQRPFRVVLPLSEADFISEGKKLHHCVGSMGYAAAYARGDKIIAFIRNPRAVRSPFFTVEFSKESGKVIQCYGSHHKKPDKRVLDFVHGAFAKAASRITKAI